jgi:hypothetical protein
MKSTPSVRPSLVVVVVVEVVVDDSLVVQLKVHEEDVEDEVVAEVVVVEAMATPMEGSASIAVIPTIFLAIVLLPPTIHLHLNPIQLHLQEEELLKLLHPTGSSKLLLLVNQKSRLWMALHGNSVANVHPE